MTASEHERNVKICVIGGDKRQYHLAELLNTEGFEVSTYAVPQKENDIHEISDFPENYHTVRAYERLCDALSGAYAVILPYPLSPDGTTLNCISPERTRLYEIFTGITASSPKLVFAGMLKESTKSIAQALGVDIIDYGKSAEITTRNAIPTAEGAIEIAMRELKCTIHNSNFAVIGYGKCGSATARLLKAMGGSVSGFARSEADRAKMLNDGVEAHRLSELSSSLENIKAVFNTVPAEIFDCHTLSLLPKEILIIDIASAPGGVDPLCAKKYGIRAFHAASLPGKYAPLTAAEIICDHVLPIIKESLADEEKA